MAVTGPLHGGAPSEHDLLELAFPIMGVSAGKEARAVCGTAFALGSDMYLTAGHVWQNALTFPLQAIGIRHPNAPDVTLYHVEDAEVLGAFDLAILRAPSTAAPNKALIWTTEALPLFAEVRAFGYPYGLDAKSRMLNIRGSQGRIVGGTSLDLLTGKPAVYELAFACPRGLSGAPLAWQDTEPRGLVVGVVLTNHITEMTVSSETEKVIENGQETTVTKVEALHLGIAIRSSVVVGIASTILGGTIGEWLRIHKLLKG